MKKTSIAIIFLLLGFSGGVLVGPWLIKTNVYHTTVKKIKQKKSDGTIVVDVDTTIEPGKTKKELRKEKREGRKEKRLERKRGE